MAISREGDVGGDCFSPCGFRYHLHKTINEKGDVKLAIVQDSETENYAIFCGRTASECVVLEIYRRARIPVRFDRSKMVALVNGRPVARVAYEKGERLAWNEA